MELYIEIFKKAPVSQAIINSDLKILDINDKFSKSFGNKYYQLVNKKLDELFPLTKDFLLNTILKDGRKSYITIPNIDNNKFISIETKKIKENVFLISVFNINHTHCVTNLEKDLKNIELKKYLTNNINCNTFEERRTS